MQETMYLPLLVSCFLGLSFHSAITYNNCEPLWVVTYIPRKVVSDINRVCVVAPMFADESTTTLFQDCPIIVTGFDTKTF